jgi:hypothetical protein
LTTEKAIGPELHAVIEAPTGAPPFLGGLPARPWPSLVRLWEEATSEEVTLVVAQLCTYGQHGIPIQRLDDLARSFPEIAPGGLAAVREVRR